MGTQVMRVVFCLATLLLSLPGFSATFGNV